MSQQNSKLQRSNRFSSTNWNEIDRAKTPKQTNLHFGSRARETKSLAKNTSILGQILAGPSNLGQINSHLKMQSIVECDVIRYYLGKGNNHEVIRRVLSQRQGYAQCSNNEFLHFKWTQNSFGFKYHNLGKDCICYNHFEFHREITNKQRLVRNMVNFCESNKLNAFNYLPVTYIIDLTTGEEDMALHSFLKFYNRNIPEGYGGLKVQSIVLPRSKYLTYLSPQQLHKKSQGNFYCQPLCPRTFFSDSGAYLWILKPTFMNRGRGVSLFSNLHEFEKLIWKYYQGEGLEDYENKVGIGEQFRLEESNTVRIFTNVGNEEEEMKSEQQVANNNMSRSVLFESTEDGDHKGEKAKSDQKIPQKPADKDKPRETSTTTGVSTNVIPQNTLKNQNNLRVLSFVVQKYIQCPMLINQRKFDIRVWALLTHNYQVYFFKEGYLRFSSHRYSTDDHNNPFIHLTNNSVQKHCNEYDQQSGNQISLSQMSRHLPNETIHSKIKAKIRDIIWLSMCSVRRKININARKECFEVFGYDFMVDAAFKTWLIEINTNPAIEECSSVLKQLVPRMIDDTFKLTLDQILPTQHKQGRERYHVTGFSDDENMWQLLGDYKQGANEKVIGKRMSFVRR